jgi:hypothetical protein
MRLQSQLISLHYIRKLRINSVLTLWQNALFDIKASDVKNLRNRRAGFPERGERFLWLLP